MLPSHRAVLSTTPRGRDPSPISLPTCGTQSLRRSRAPTAVACGKDVIALGALSAARLLGLRVPSDVTVIGFDNIPAAGWPFANLTTVRTEFALLATVAVDLLFNVLSDVD
jgi:LacI family transcriptional regulator